LAPGEIDNPVLLRRAAIAPQIDDVRRSEPSSAAVLLLGLSLSRPATSTRRGRSDDSLSPILFESGFLGVPFGIDVFEGQIAMRVAKGRPRRMEVLRQLTHSTPSTPLRALGPEPFVNVLERSLQEIFNVLPRIVGLVARSASFLVITEEPKSRLSRTANLDKRYQRIQPSATVASCGAVRLKDAQRAAQTKAWPVGRVASPQ
jgi:hypothetical protein